MGEIISGRRNEVTDMIKLILILLCFAVIFGGFVCFCIVKANTPYDKEQDDLEQIKALKELIK
mgnify:CR=1 FL=1